MSSSQSYVVELIAASMSSLGLIINIFITLVNVLDWMYGRKMKPYDKLMLSLGLSRVLLLFCFLFRIINRLCELNAYSSEAARWILRTAQLSLDFSSLWFSMWLCVLYYVKIAIFKNTLLIRLKLSIPQMISPVILTSSVISLVFGFIFAFNVKETSDIMNIVYVPKNGSISKDLKFMLPSYIVGHFLPFLVVSISSFLLIGIISVHLQHVKKNITNVTSLSLDAHISAIRSVCLLQMMNMCNLIGTILFRFHFSNKININIPFLMLNFYPTLHSAVLITGNVRLKRAFWRILDCVRGCWKMEVKTSTRYPESKTETGVQRR